MAAPAAESNFQTQPAFGQKYNARKAKEIIKEVHRTKLTGKAYHPDNAAVWTREISDEVKHQLKALNLDRYKFVVQVVLGEQKGEGVMMGARCLWDPNADDYAEDTFKNETIFCVTAAFGVYIY